MFRILGDGAGRGSNVDGSSADSEGSRNNIAGDRSLEDLISGLAIGQNEAIGEQIEAEKWNGERETDTGAEMMDLMRQLLESNKLIAFTLLETRREVKELKDVIEKLSLRVIPIQSDVGVMKGMLNSMGLRGMSGTRSSDLETEAELEEHYAGRQMQMIDCKDFTSGQQSSATKNVVASVIYSMANLVQQGLNNKDLGKDETDDKGTYQITKAVIDAIFSKVAEEKTKKKMSSVTVSSAKGKVFDLDCNTIGAILADSTYAYALSTTIGILTTAGRFFISPVLCDLLSNYSVDYSSKKMMKKANSVPTPPGTGRFLEMMSKRKSSSDKSGIGVNEMKKAISLFDWSSKSGESLCGSMLAGKMAADGQAFDNYDFNGNLLKGTSAQVLKSTGSRSALNSIGRVSATQRNWQIEEGE
jgi:hypothetical protein